MKRPTLCWLGLHRMRPTEELSYPVGNNAWRVWRCTECPHEALRLANTRWSRGR